MKNEKTYQLGQNAAGETPSQVANYILADLRIRFRGDHGGQLLCDSLTDSIISALKESAIAAIESNKRGKMKIVLCTKRTLPPGKRQDGFQPLPTIARYDIIKEVEIRDDVGVVIYQGDYYINANESINHAIVFEKVFSQEIE